ncbi:MAG: hypothetical protein O3C40_14385 [Planctomycetota bacterium]|nr:hypothetical protein [Planctomycetota bacterium]
MLLLLAGGSAWVVWPFAGVSETPLTHDGLRYYYLANHFAEAVHHGFHYPRWLPNAYGGYGYPTFVFYQPGFFFVVLPFALVFQKATTAVYAALVLLLFVGGLGAYKTGCELGDSTTGALVSLLFLITPYLYVDLLVRGDFSELTAMLLSPWALFALMRTFQTLRTERVAVGSMSLFALALTAVIFSHPIVALFFVPSTILIGVYVALGDEKWASCIMHLAAGLSVALILSSPYWFHLISMKEFVCYESAISGGYGPENHVVHFPQFFSRAWGYGYSAAGLSDEISFQLGLPHAIFALVGFFSMPHSRWVQASFILYVALILLMTPELGRVWHAIPILRFVQFPWRILAVTSTFQLICMSGCQPVLAKLGRCRVASGILIIGGCCLWYADQFFPNPDRFKETDRFIEEHHRARPSAFHTYAAENEFTPRTATALIKGPPRGSRPMVELSAPRALQPDVGNNAYVIRYGVEPGSRCDLVINQAYFPGWRVDIDGRTIPSERLLRELMPDGRIRLKSINERAHQLIAYYEGPPGNRFVSAFAGLCFALIASYWICVAGLWITRTRATNGFARWGFQ